MRFNYGFYKKEKIENTKECASYAKDNLLGIAYESLDLEGYPEILKNIRIGLIFIGVRISWKTAR